MTIPSTPEERLLWDIFGTQEKEAYVSENLDVQQYTRKAFPVEAIRVTEDNIEEVAKWCTGEIRIATENEKPVASVGDRYIKVRVENPLTERQTKAFVGDWVLYAGKGYKVYADKAFRRSFDPPADPGERGRNVFAEGGGAGHGVSGISSGGSGGANPGGSHGH